MTPRALPRGTLRGRIRVPGSKSLTNRALVAAALVPGESRIGSPLVADDTLTLADCLSRLGARIGLGPAAWTVEGPLSPPESELLLDVGPAGTPARFLLAVCAALPGRYVLDGSARMRERPMGPLVDALRSLGASIQPLGREGFLPLRVTGRRLAGGPVRIRGDVSSQFLSALLLLSPLLGGEIELEVEGRAASAAYVTLTRRVAERFAHGPTDYEVPGDDSAACFPIAGAVVSGGRVAIEGLDPEPVQPDAAFRAWARAAGAAVTWEGSTLTVEASGKGRPLPLVADVDGAPDAALPLAALVAFASGTSTLCGVERLREKESDRLAAAVDLLERAGARASVGADPGGRETLVVDGEAGRPRAASFRAWGDHRVAMAASVLALVLPGGSTVEDPAVVTKSFPSFFEEWERLVAGDGR